VYQSSDSGVSVFISCMPGMEFAVGLHASAKAVKMKVINNRRFGILGIFSPLLYSTSGWGYLHDVIGNNLNFHVITASATKKKLTNGKFLLCWLEQTSFL
jgi:hypothetical protein